LFVQQRQTLPDKSRKFSANEELLVGRETIQATALVKSRWIAPKNISFADWGV